MAASNEKGEATEQARTHSLTSPLNKTPNKSQRNPLIYEVASLVKTERSPPHTNQTHPYSARRESLNNLHSCSLN